MPRCPNLNDEEVFKDFNDLIERLGGKAMREDHIANREGYIESLDKAQKSAYHRAHYLWDRHPSPKSINALLDSIARLEQKLQKEAAPAKAGKAEEAFAGQFGKGMNELNARQAQQRLAKQRPGIDWKVEPSNLENPFQVAGDKTWTMFSRNETGSETINPDSLVS